MRYIAAQLQLWVPQLKVWVIIPDLLAIAGLVVGLWAPASILTTITMASALAVLLFRQREVIFTTRAGAGGLGSYLVARYVLLASVAARLHSLDALTGVETGIISLGAVVLAGERIVRAGNRLVVPSAMNLPKLRARVRPRFSYRYVFVTNMTLAAAMIANSALGGVLLPVEILIASAGFALTIWALIDIVSRIKSCYAVELRRRKVLEKIQPEFYLYWDTQPGGLYQVSMWLPYLDRIGVPYVIIVRNAASMRAIAKKTKRPIVFCADISELDSILIGSARGVFYVNNGTRNTHMVRYSHLKHIQLNHGESDKAPSISPVFRIYDLNFVAGQGAIDRFSRNGVKMPPDIFRIVGRPQIEDVREAAEEVSQVGEPTVLYAPTWSGYQEDANYTSLRVGEEIVRALIARGCRVVFRPHPFSENHPKTKDACERIIRLLKRDQTATGREHLFGIEATARLTVFDCFNLSDAMIADVSSVVADYLHSKKPLAMVAMEQTTRDFERSFPMARAAYVIEAEGGAVPGLNGVLEKLLGSDPKRLLRADLATYYLGEIPHEGYAEEFVRTAKTELGLTLT